MLSPMYLNESDILVEERQETKEIVKVLSAVYFNISYPSYFTPLYHDLSHGIVVSTVMTSTITVPVLTTW
jgi:hypothetical protein